MDFLIQRYTYECNKCASREALSVRLTNCEVMVRVWVLLGVLTCHSRNTKLVRFWVLTRLLQI